MFDVIYVTWFVHLGSLFSGYVWYLYLVIPVFAAWKAWTLFLRPLWNSRSDAQAAASNASSKTAAKKEKKQKVKYVRS